MEEKELKQKWMQRQWKRMMGGKGKGFRMKKKTKIENIKKEGGKNKEGKEQMNTYSDNHISFQLKSGAREI